MADTLTTNYELTLPEPGSSDLTWGIKLNSNFSTIDDLIFGNTTDIASLTITVEALQALIAATVPPGAIMAFAMSTVPTGWLEMNGALVSRTTYASLFAAIGTTHGAGDGSTTFKLPDARGEFIRGWDNGRGVDTGRVFGSAQADELKNHNHDIIINSSSSGSATRAMKNNNAATGGDTTAAAPVQGFGGAETRPRNIAMLYCIKT